jgi:hypothetical protein
VPHRVRADLGAEVTDGALGVTFRQLPARIGAQRLVGRSRGPHSGQAAGDVGRFSTGRDLAGTAGT